MYGDDSMKTLKDIIFSDIKVNNNDNYLIFNEGGIGKTTQMKSAYLELIKAHIDKIVPIFIDCKSLNFKSNYPLLSAILKKYCGNDCMESTHRERLEKLICNETPQQDSYKFIIFIDGINECESNKYKALQAINKLIKSPNNKIVVSSRINEDELVSKGFKKLKVKEFTDVQIITYLNSKGINNNGVSIELNRLNPSLLKILRRPMFLKVFANTYSEKHIFPDIYTTNIVRKADLLQGFLDKILEDKENQHDNKIVPEYLERKFALERYLPALAYEMSLLHSYSIHNDVLNNLRTKVFDSNYFERFESEDETTFENISSLKNINNICIVEFSLLNKSNKDYAFSHQVWQDFFCAKFYTMCIEYDIIDVFDNTISASVRQFIGEIVKNENGECECDFEIITDLEKAKKSPINTFLQSHHLNSSKPLSPLQTCTLIEIMKTSRNNNITAKYDNLDLKYVKFYGDSYSLPNSTFAGSWLSKDSFVSRIKGDIISISIDDGGESIVALCNDCGSIYLFVQNLKNNNYIKFELPVIYNQIINTNHFINLFYINNTNVVVTSSINENNKQDFVLYFDLKNRILKKVKKMKNNNNNLFQISDSKIILHSDGVEYVIEINKSEDCLLLNGESLKQKLIHMNCICARIINKTIVEVFAGTNDSIFCFNIDIIAKTCNYNFIQSNKYKIRKISVSKHSEKLIYKDDCGITILNLTTNQRYEIYAYDFRKEMRVCANGKKAIMVLQRWINELCFVIIDTEAKCAIQSVFFNNKDYVSDSHWYSISDESDIFAIACNGKISVWKIGDDKLVSKLYEYDIPKNADNYFLNIVPEGNKDVLYFNSNNTNYRYTINSITKKDYKKDQFLLEIQLQKAMYLNYSNIVGCDFSDSNFADDNLEDVELLKKTLYENGGKLKINSNHFSPQTVVSVPIKKLIMDKVNYYNCEYEEYQIEILRSFMISCLNFGLFNEEQLYDSVSEICKTIKSIKVKSIETFPTIIKYQNNVLSIFCESDSFDIIFFLSIVTILSWIEFLEVDTAQIESLATKLYITSIFGKYFDENKFSDIPMSKFINMEKDHKFVVISDEEENVKYEIFYICLNYEIGKKHVVYTDNITDEKGKINVYLSIFDLNEEDPILSPFETQEERPLIESILGTLANDDEIDD